MLNLIAQTPVDISKEFQVKPGVGIGDAPLFQSLGSFVSVLLRNIYVLAGVLLLVLLIFGGISIILSAGSGDAKKTAQGQKTLTSALIGFIIIFASYWIIQIIQYITGVNILGQ